MTGDRAALAAAAAYVGDWLRHQRRLCDIPGYAVAIRHCGDLLLDDCDGVVRSDTGELLRPDHLFRVASHSKAFSAAAVMLLRERGKLGLDDRLGHHIPDLPPAVACVTVEQLLSHGTGLPRDTYESSYWSLRRPFAATGEVAADIAKGPVQPPNTGLKYSNLGYALVGRLIEAVTGGPYIAWMNREIVASAGLADSSADLDAEAGARLASGHSAKLPAGKRSVLDAAVAVGPLAASAGFVSSPRDLTRFFSQLAPGAAASFLELESRREMVRPRRAEDYSDAGQHYGLGLMMGTVAEEAWFGHGGGFPGFISKTAILPERDLAISICTNAADGKAHAWVDGAISIVAAFAKAGAGRPAAGWEGRWWNMWGAVDLVRLGDDILLASPDALQPFDYCPRVRLTGPDEGTIVEASSFHHPGETVRLERTAEWTPNRLWIAGDYWLPEAAYLSSAPR